MKHLDISREIAGLASYATEPLAREPLVRRRVQAELEKKFLVHARKVALAKVGRRPEPVPLDGEVNVRARASIAKTLTKALGKVKKQAVALVKQQGGLKKVWGPAAWEASAEARRAKAEQSQAFKDWFGNSKVVDAKGKPLIVWHGSPDIRNVLKEGFKTVNERYTGTPGEGEGFFAAEDYGVANSYADDHRAFDYQNAEPATVPLYLSIKNPMIVDAKGKPWRETAKHVQQAKDGGHDGLIIKNSIDYYNSEKMGGPKNQKPTNVYVWFKSSQAKSALQGPLVSRVDKKPLEGSGPNIGTFDPKSSDIHKLAKADDNKDLPSKIAKELDLSEVVYAAIATGDDLSEAAVMAAQHTIKSLGLGDDEKLTDLVNEKAVNIARKQAAMLVGRHYDEDGNLVESADPEYQIDETTRDGIRKIISDGLADNIGTDQIAKNINEDFIVSEKRAGLIARSEVARANSLSVLDSLFTARDDAGVNLKKAWLTAGDDLVDEVCQENEDAGPINLEDDFPSGDDAPLAHPFCRCVLTTVVLDDDDAEKLAKFGYVGGVKKFNPNHDERGQFASGPSAGFAAAPAPNEISILPEQQQRDHEDAEVVHEAFTKAAKDAATELHYNPDHVQVLETESPFELNGKTYQAAGRAFLNTDRIVIYHPPSSYMTPQQVPALMAHEVMHQKYHAYLQAVRAESEKVQALPKNSVPVQLDTGTDTPRTVMRDAMKPDGTLRPPYDKQFPLYQADAELKRNWEKMEKEDGLTEYSRDWWQAAKSGGATFESAYHETLAEMARVDYEAKAGAASGAVILPRDKPLLAPSELKVVPDGLASTGKPSKDWLRLYKAVNKHWEKVRA